MTLLNRTPLVKIYLYLSLPNFFFVACNWVKREGVYDCLKEIKNEEYSNNKLNKKWHLNRYKIKK